eukprot:448467_1
MNTLVLTCDFTTHKPYEWRSCIDANFILAFQSTNYLEYGCGYGDASIYYGNNTQSIGTFVYTCRGSNCPSNPFHYADINIYDFVLFCNDNYCPAIDITVSSSALINCDHWGGCTGNFKIGLTNGADASIYCRSCYDSSFNLYSENIMLSNSVQIICKDCSRANFNFTHISNATVTCGSYACDEMQIFATHTNLLNLNCSGRQSCEDGIIYCPYHKPSATNVYCADEWSSCYNLDFYVDDWYTKNYLNIDCPSSRACPWTSIDFFCPTSSAQLINHHECNSASSSSCCPWNQKQVSCNNEKDCYINCKLSPCKNALVNATTSDTVEINCIGAKQNKYYTYDTVCWETTIECAKQSCIFDCGGQECKWVTINTPTDNSDIIINCDGCHSMTVNGQNANNIFFNCTNCYSITINAQNANNITMDCFHCGDVYIYGYWANIVTLFFNGDYYLPYPGSYASTIWANYSSTVDITIQNAEDNTLFVPNADYVSVICQNGCQYSNLYLPEDARNVYITCYLNPWEQCYRSSDIYAGTSMSSLNVTINGCGKCHEIDHCIRGWKIQCNSKVAVLNGNNCTYNYCGCQELANNIYFYNDPTDPLCLYPGRLLPTLRPTLMPTLILIPTDDLDESTNITLWVVFGSLGFTIIVVGIIMVRKKQSSKNKKDRLQAEIQMEKIRQISKVTEGGDFKQKLRKPSAPPLDQFVDNKHRRNDSNNSYDNQCVFCMDAQRDHLCTPCGHLCLCSNCKEKIGGKCPICRAKCTVIKV